MPIVETVIEKTLVERYIPPQYECRSTEVCYSDPPVDDGSGSGGGGNPPPDPPCLKVITICDNTGLCTSVYVPCDFEIGGV